MMLPPPGTVMDAKELRAWVRERIAEFGSQKAFADAVKAPPSRVSEFVSAGKNPRPSLLRALGLKVAYVRGR